MEKLKQLFEEYITTTNPKFADKKSSFYLASGFSEWLEDRYDENFSQLAKECRIDTVEDLHFQIQEISS